MTVKKPPLIATILTLLGITILCALGTWQVQRLEWKRNIIKALDTAYDSKNTYTPDLTKSFSYGRVEGKFLADKAFLIGPYVRDSKVGNNLIVPILLANEQTLLVNMGWSPWNLESMPIYHANGKNVSFDGITRKPSWNNFTPENKPEKNVWHKLDIKEIAQAKQLKNPAPVIFYAESSNYKFDAAFPNNERQYPNNNHLQYAIFWYTMAAILIIIFYIRFIKPANH